MKKRIVLLYTILASCCLQVLGEEHDSDKQDIIDGPPVTRSEVILTADKFVRVRWEMKEVNQTGTTCDGNFKSDYPAGPRIGMGYMWNGWDDTDDFLKKITAGYGTGTGGNGAYNDYPKSCVTGTSCTGFVSRAWHLNRKYTLDYPQYPHIKEQFHKITQDIAGVSFWGPETDKLKKGDAFINSAHIILFVYETRDGAAMVMDSDLDGVKFRKMSWRKLGIYQYKAIRYNNIKEVSNPPGTIAEPVPVSSDDFPVSLHNNTRDFVSMEFDKYSVDPTINEQGPEVIYKLQMKSKKKIAICIDEFLDENINNNIYLLKSLKKDSTHFASDCVARGDSLIEQELDAGTYYIVVDSGEDQPGEYKLTIK